MDERAGDREGEEGGITLVVVIDQPITTLKLNDFYMRQRDFHEMKVCILFDRAMWSLLNLQTIDIIYDIVRNIKIYCSK